MYIHVYEINANTQKRNSWNTRV